MTHRNNTCPHMLNYRPPRIALTLSATAAALQFVAPTSWAQLQALPVGGAALAAFGLLIMLCGWWLFRVHDTAVCPTAHTTTLITGDIYRLTRNPMYLGIVLMILGAALGSGSVFFYVAALTFFLIIDFVFCPYEEARVESSFGVEFARYRRRVRRWL